jgi:hypothetical protein
LDFYSRARQDRWGVRDSLATKEEEEEEEENLIVICIERLE